MKTTIFLLALLSVSMAGGIGALYSVMDPQSNWMNPESGSWIELYLLSGVKTSSATDVSLLIGLPFTTASLGVSVTVMTDSCNWQGAEWSGDAEEADDSIRGKREGLTYYYVSTSAAYVQDTVIVVRLSMDLPTTSGWTKPIHIALLSTPEEDYQIWAENDNIAPFYILEAAKSGMTVADVSTSDSKRSSMSSSISVITSLTPTLSYRRIKMVVSGGYELDSASTFMVSDVNSLTTLVTAVDAADYTVNVISSNEVDILFTNTSEWRSASTIQIAWTIKSPDYPTSANLNLKTMDLYGPNIIETGTLSAFLTCKSVAWSSGYPKVTFSYGLDASSTSTLKDSYGLYTVGGTSLTYNTLGLQFKTTAALPSGTQTLSITIGSSTVQAYVATNTLTHTFTALAGEEVECSASSTMITCTGVDLEGKSGGVYFRVAYTKSGTSITDFAKATLSVDGKTIVSGTPTLKTGFTTPIGNRSPVSSSYWGQYISSAFSTAYVDTDVELTSVNIDNYLPLQLDYNGLRVGDSQMFYLYSRIGPYSYYTSNKVSTGADPSKMFLELTVPSDISAAYINDDADNVLVYIDEAGMLNTELDQDFYWESSSSSTSGWLKYAVERPLCDPELDGTISLSEDDQKNCVSWYCYEDMDGDGSYDSPQPCKPVRACDTSSALLWYPEADRLDRHASIIDNLDRVRKGNHITFSDLADLNMDAFADHSANEVCRPVLECDTTDASNGEARHWNKHSSGNDCRRSLDVLCVEESNEGDGILDQYSDGSSGCIEVDPCDIDTDGDGTLDALYGGGYCNPISINSVAEDIYQQCDEKPSKSSSNMYATTHTLSIDCIEQPLCTAKSVDSVDGLDTLEVVGDCVEILSDSNLCTHIEAGVFTMQSQGGLTQTSTGTSSCWFVPVCDMATSSADDLEWITDERVDGKYCTMDYPICNAGDVYDDYYNKAMFVWYKKSFSNFFDASATAKLILSDGYRPHAPLSDQFSDCYTLDSCDTFENDLLRVNSGGYACYKLDVDNSYDDVAFDSSYQGIQCYRNWMDGNAFVHDSIVEVGDTSDAGETVNYQGGYGDCVAIHVCNAEDDDGNAVYVDRHGWETDCYEHSKYDYADVSNRKMGIYGAITFSDAATADLYLPQATCQWRSTIIGDLDTMPWGWDCETLDSSELCDQFYGDRNVFESLDGDSGCQFAAECQENAWIQNSKYKLHIFADMGEWVGNTDYKNMEQWYTYSNYLAAKPRFMSQYCIPQYESSTVDYIDPTDESGVHGMYWEKKMWEFGLTPNERRRRNLGNDADYFADGVTENYIHVPGTFLFIEDIVSSEDDDGNVMYVSDTNPVAHASFEEGGDGYNIFKVQAAQITAEYVTAPRAHRVETDTFTVQTWNLLFPTPLSGTDGDHHNIFAFYDTSVALGSGNQLVTVAGSDVHLLDLYWAVYFAAATNDIAVDLTTSPSLKGFENLVVYDENDEDGDTSEYLDKNGLYWTTYSYSGVSRSTASVNNYLVIYGTSVGDDTDLAASGTLTLFFQSIQGVPMWSADDGDEVVEIDCSATGADVSNCQYVDDNGALTSVSVAYTVTSSSTSTHTLYNPLYWGRIELDIADSLEDSWSIILPIDGGSTSVLYPLIGFQDSSSRLIHLSGYPNDNVFGPGSVSSTLADNYIYGYTSSSYHSTLAALYASSSDVLRYYGLNTVSAPSIGAWLDFGDSEYMVCETVTTTALNLYTSSSHYALDSDDGGFGGIALCAEWDYRGAGWNLEWSTDEYYDSDYQLYPNFYGCWDTLVVYDDYCTVCNIDDWVVGSIDSPASITLTDFVLPYYYGTTLPANTNIALYNKYGVIDVIIDVNDAGALYDTNVVDIITPSVTANKGYHSTRLAFQLSTPCGIPDSSQIILIAVTGDDSANYLTTPKNQDFEEPPCYIVQSGEIMECSFSWTASAVTINVWDEIAEGTFDVHLYGLYAEDSVDDTATQIIFDVEIDNSAGEILYENDDTVSQLFVSYSSSSYTVSVSDVNYVVDNYGWNSALMFEVSTSKSFYENDYISVYIENFAPGNSENLECTLWADEHTYDARTILCEVESTNDMLWIYPAVDMDSSITAFNVHVLLTNVVTLSYTSKITATLWYNGDYEGVSSVSTIVPAANADYTTLGDVTVGLSSEYEGVRSTMSISFTTDEAIDAEDIIVVGLSNDYSASKTDSNELYVKVNGADAYAMPYYLNMLLIYGPFTAKAASAVTVSIEGLITPNLAASESRTVYVGTCNETVEGYLENSPLHLNQMGTAKITKDPASLEKVNLLYPRFESLSVPYTRRETNYAWSWDVPTDEIYDAGSIVKLYLKSNFHAWMGSTSSVSCSIKQVGLKSASNIADKCTYSHNAVSFSLKSALTSGATYSVEITGVPNPDWEMCNVNVADIEIWDSTGTTLSAKSAPGLCDSDEIDVMSSQYSLEFVGMDSMFDHIGLPIGFYAEMEISTSTGYFADEVLEITIGSGVGNVKIESGSSAIGGTSMWIHLGVIEGEIEAAYPLSLKASINDRGMGVIPDTDGLDRLPVIMYWVMPWVSSLQVNEGVDITVEAGGLTWPLLVCLEDAPINAHEFTITVASDSDDVTLDPKIVCDTASIVLDMMHHCEYIVINATDPAAKADMASVLTITGDEYYYEHSGKVTVVSAGSTAGGYVKITDSSESQYSASLTVSINSTGVVYIHAGPASVFTSLDAEDILPLLNGEISVHPLEVRAMFVYTDSEVVVSMTDLLRGISYEYEIHVDYANEREGLNDPYVGNFTTTYEDPNGYKATRLTVNAVGEYSSEEVVEYVCDLCRYFSIPKGDVSTTLGVNCADHWPDVEVENNDSNEEDEEESTGKKNKRILADEEDEEEEEEEEIDRTVTTAFDAFILPALSEQTNSVTIDATALVDDLGAWWDIEIHSVEVVATPIDEVDSANLSTNKVTKNSVDVVVKGVQDSKGEYVAGVVCWAVSKGKNDLSHESIKSGDGAVENSCDFYDPDAEEGSEQTFKVTGLNSDTDYYVYYYGSSIDNRIFSSPTDVMSAKFTTSAEVVEVVEEEEAEEEFGYLSSFGFIALLLAFILNL